MTNDLVKRLRNHDHHIRGRLIEGLVDLCIDDMVAAADRIEELEAALRPFANKFLYPDDTDVADYIRDDEDWDEENNNQMIDDVFIPRGWIRAARAALKGEIK